MTNDSESRYTLAEAQRLLNRRECESYGHSWDVQETLAGPVGVFCGRCGWSGTVSMGPRP